MNQPSQQPDPKRAQYVFNLTVAGVAGQVGFITLFIVLVALFGGLWLDKQFDTKPIFTIVLMLASVPVTLVMMFWVVRSAVKRIKPVEPSKNTQTEEEANRGRSS